MTHFHELFTEQLSVSSGGGGGEVGEAVITMV